MTRMPFTGAATVILALAITGTAAAAQLKPFDEASRDAGLIETRERLVAAVEARDFQALAPMLSANIQLSFGGHYGIGEAAKMFSQDPGLWAKLAMILRQGGGFQKEGDTGREIFVAPYTFFAEPPAGGDAFGTLVLAGEGIKVRRKPTAKAKVVATVSHEVVSADLSTNPWQGDWVRIKLEGGRVGYVARKHAVFGVGHRAGFEKTADGWKMVFFLAGD